MMQLGQRSARLLLAYGGSQWHTESTTQFYAWKSYLSSMEVPQGTEVDSDCDPQKYICGNLQFKQNKINLYCSLMHLSASKSFSACCGSFQNNLWKKGLYWVLGFSGNLHLANKRQMFRRKQKGLFFKIISITALKIMFVQKLKELI